MSLSKSNPPNETVRLSTDIILYIKPLTEFLSLEALKYLNGNIIESNDFVDCSESVSVYCCLLPMVEILKNSALWFDVLSCKKMNDYSLLEDRIGKDAKRIAELFNLTYVKRNVEFFDKNLPEEDELEELTKIIKKIENNNCSDIAC